MIAVVGTGRVRVGERSIAPHRRARRLPIVALIAAVVLTATACWPQVGAGPDRRSYNPAETTLTPANVADLREQWRVVLPEGSTEPIVTESGVYVTSGFNAYALDRNSGDSRWTRSIYPQGGGSRSLGTPLVAADELLVPVSLYSLGAVADAALLLPVRRRDRVARRRARRGRPRGLASRLAPRERGCRRPPRRRRGHRHHHRPRRRPWRRRRLGWLRHGVEDTARRDPDARHLGPVRGRTAAPSPPTTRRRRAPTCPDYEVRDCRPRWYVTFDGTPRPVVIGEDRSTLYVGTVGRLASTRSTPPLATTRWRPRSGRRSRAAPALARGTLYVPTEAGGVVAVSATGCGAPTCSPRWSATSPAAGDGAARRRRRPGVRRLVRRHRVRRSTPPAVARTTCAALWSEDTRRLGVRGLAVAFGALFTARPTALSRYDP